MQAIEKRVNLNKYVRMCSVVGVFDNKWFFFNIVEGTFAGTCLEPNSPGSAEFS